MQRNRRRAAAGLAMLTLITAGLAGCSKPGPDDALKDFLDGWKKNDLSKVGFVTASGAKISDTDVNTQLKTLSGDLSQQKPAVSETGSIQTTGDNATGQLQFDWTLPGGAHWKYQNPVKLTKAGSDGWRIVWEPALIEKDLTTGDKLTTKRVGAERGSITDATGEPMVTKRDVVEIGIEPQKVTNLAQLLKDLTTAFAKVDVTLENADVTDRVNSAKKDAFVSLITLRQADYQKIVGQVQSLDGVVTNRYQKDLAPTRVFARALLGTADVATREDIDKNPNTIAVNDIVGHGGLQAKYDTTLRGTPGVSVVIAKTTPDDKTTGSTIYSVAPVAGKSIKTSLDVKTQNAADAALASITQPSSLVAIKVSDGTVLAVANGPDGGTDDVALTGQVPPGSTFKTISAYGLLSAKKVTPDSTVNCPASATVGSTVFKNSGGEQFGAVPFHVDYSKSCNTAFVGLSSKLGADGLHQAATALGLGTTWDMGVSSFSGKVSPADSPSELAQASFGQGQTVVSPIAMASVAASVARGQFKQPELMLDPAPANPAADGPQLDATAIAGLRSMMREVVTSGTGSSLKSVKGKPVYGKTGTAEFDADSKDTHSWFIGYQGDIAFAVIVQKGGAGADAAVPAVNRFLTALN